MEWAGGSNWESYVDDLAEAGDDGAFKILRKEKKMYPTDWEWRGEHWKIARWIEMSRVCKRLVIDVTDTSRHLSGSSYRYLTELPLVLHLPSLHSFVVHAGLLPHNPLKALEDASQPLLIADTTANDTSTDILSSSRASEELSIIRDVPQNTVPWNLINMRSIRTKGKKKGQPTKSSNKGTPWSKLWKKEMARCRGPGAWQVEDLLTEEWEENDVEVDENDELEDRIEARDEDEDEEHGLEDGVEESGLKCSPVTVIYGHAGRSI